MLKIIAFLLVVLLVTGGLGVYYLVENLDQIAEAAIERNGSRALGSEVEVGSVLVEPKNGRATIRNMTVANPPGYSENPLFSFEEIGAEIDIKNLAISKIYSDRPTVRVEVKDGDNNLLALRRSLKAASSPQSTETPSTDTAKTEKAAEQTATDKAEKLGDDMEFQINLIEITNIQAQIFESPDAEPQTATVDRLRLTDLKGTRQEIARQITSQLVGIVVAELLEKTLLEKLEGRYGDKLKDVGDKLKSLLK